MSSHLSYDRETLSPQQESRTSGRLAITRTSCRGGTVIVRVTGEVDMTTADQLDRQLGQLSATKTIVDLEGTKFVAVAGVRILLNAARRAQASRNVFAVAAASPITARVLWLTAADAELAMYDTVLDAKRELS